MESAIQIVNKELKTFVRRRRLPPIPPPPPPPLLPLPSLSSSSSVPTALNLEPFCSKKRTRDLPNFSECHACGFRVDAIDGRSRLNSLFSEWRIVLLCKKCFSLVESSQVCSYCFADSSSDSFICCQCNHRVHRECFVQYSGVAPWSYYSLDSEFSVCIDCWVPKPIVTARAVLKRRRIRSKNIEVSDLRSTKDSISRDCRSLSAIVKDAKCMAEKKVDAAVRARERALKKAAVAKRASKLASDALSLVAQRVVSAAKESRESADAELAVLLHRAITSSPRFSKNLCSVKSNHTACENTRADDGDASLGALRSRGFDFFKTPQVLLLNNACNPPDNAAASEHSVRAKDHVSPLEIHRLKSISKDLVPTKANAFLVKCDTESENVKLPPKEDLISRSIKSMSAGCNHDRLCSESQLPHKQDKYVHSLPTDERCIEKPFHYFFKYRRKDTSTRYMLKYSKRNSTQKRMLDCKPNILVDGTCLGVTSSSAVTSNASCGGCVVPLQACDLGMNAVQEISNQGDRYGRKNAGFFFHFASKSELLKFCP